MMTWGWFIIVIPRTVELKHPPGHRTEQISTEPLDLSFGPVVVVPVNVHFAWKTKGKP